MQAATPVTAYRIILSMAATKVNVKEQHRTSSVGWRNITAWYGHETDKCWGEVKNILLDELDIGVPTTFVLENHGNVVVHRGIGFPSSGSVGTSIDCVRTAHFNTKIIATNQTDGELTGKHNSCRGMRWSLQESEWTSNSKHVDDTTRLWRLKMESKETPTSVTKATGRRRDIDENKVQHDVQASREAAGTSSPAVGPSIRNLAVQTPGRPEHAACMSEHTSGSRRSDQGNCAEHCGRTLQTSVLRCEAIADQTDKRKVRVTRHCQTLAGDGIVVARAGGTARVDGWIIKDRVDIEVNLPDLGADGKGSRGEGDLWQQCNM